MKLFRKIAFFFALAFAFLLASAPAFAAHLLQVAPASPFVNFQVKLIAIAGIVFTLLQAIKKFIPAVGGPYAVILNVAFTLIGGIAVAHPGDFSSISFIVGLILAALSSAGIHGTWSKLTS